MSWLWSLVCVFGSNAVAQELLSREGEVLETPSRTSPATRAPARLSSDLLPWSPVVEPSSEAIAVESLPVAQFAAPRGTPRWDWPVVGVLSSLYGPRWGRVHEGIDIAAAVGTPVLAASSGVVVSAYERGGYGLAVEVQHADGSHSLYAHLSVIEVEPAESVSLGQVLGRVGETGNTTGPHLHFELHDATGQVVDPASVLP